MPEVGSVDQAPQRAPRRRVHARRWLVLALLALLVAALLEANRWLPGVWPGGGGTSGSRATRGGVRKDPADLVPGPLRKPADPAGRSIAVVVVPPPADAEGRASPSDATGGFGLHFGDRVGVPVPGRPGSFLLPQHDDATADPTATGAADGATAAPDLFEVRHGDVVVWHGAPALGAAARGLPTTWRVDLPAAPVPARPTPGPGRDVEVRDEDGPVADAMVEWVGRGAREATARSDARGRVHIPREAGPLVRINAMSERHGETSAYAHLDAPGPISLRLVRNVALHTVFVDEAGARLRPRVLRIHAPGATPRALEREEGFDELRRVLPQDVVAVGLLEVEVPGRPSAVFPLASLAATTVVPAGRPVLVAVRDGEGRPVAGAAVSARWTTAALEHGGGPLLAASGTTDAQGETTLVVPRDRDGALVVAAEGHAPSSAPLPRDVEKTTLALAPGGRARVRVVDDEGRAVPYARVVVLLRVEDGRGEAVGDRRTAVTDASGVASVADLPMGTTLEALAHAPGFAWGAAPLRATSASDAEATVTLRRGARLHLVVEDPDGVPLPGVSVRSVERAEGASPAPAPDDPDRAAWVTDGNGVLVVDDLAPHPRDLYLHAAGWRDAIVPAVTPGPTIVFVTLVRPAR